MSLLDYFKITKSNSASKALERLQILVAHERASATDHPSPSYLPEMKEELLAVIRKYVNVDEGAISVSFEQEGNQETMELNIVMPEDSTKQL